MSSIIQPSFLDLHRAAQFFEKNDPINGFVHFDLFCKYAHDHEQLKEVEHKVFRSIGKVEGQPTCKSHPDSAPDDCGRAAFYNKEGKPASNLIKSKVLDAFLVRSTKKELKRISDLFRSGNETGGFAAFDELFHLSQQIPQLNAIQDLVYHSTWVRMGEPTSENQPEIAHSDFGRLAFHNREDRSCSYEEKADALDLVIRIIDCSKLDSQIINRLPKDETYWITEDRPSKNDIVQQSFPLIHHPSFHYSLSEVADNYFRTNPSYFPPVSNLDLPRQPEEPKAVMEKLFKTYQGICFGDFHSDYFTIDFLHAHMDFFQKMGVKTLFMELFWHDIHQNDLDVFNRGGELSSLLKIRCADIDDPIPSRYGPYNTVSVLKAARDRGIKVVGIDVKGSFSTEKNPDSRIKKLNYAAFKIIEKEKGNDKFITWTGKGHLTNNTIIKSRKHPSDNNINSVALEISTNYNTENNLDKIISCATETQKTIAEEEQLKLKNGTNENITSDTFISNIFQHLFQEPPTNNEILSIRELADHIHKKTTVDYFIPKISPGLSGLIHCPSIDMLSETHPYPLPDCGEHIETVQFGDIDVVTKERYLNANFEFTDKKQQTIPKQPDFI